MLIALLIVARAVHIAASILVAGSFTFDVIALGFVRRPVSGGLYEVERSLLQLAVWSLGAALVSAVLWFWLEVVIRTGLSFADSFTASTWKTVLLETVFGHVWQFRLGVIAAALVLAVCGLAGNNASRRRTILALWFLSVVLLVSLAWISHAAAGRAQPLGLIGDALHLCAAGGWVGGLVPLAIFLARAGASLSLGEGAPRVVERFSTLSLCCVSVLVASGISNSWLLVGSIHALFTTPYGWLLLFKLTLFAVLMSFGARNRFLVKTKLYRSTAVSDWLPQLRRNVICEACLAATVMAIVACLGVTPPARHP